MWESTAALPKHTLQEHAAPASTKPYMLTFRIGPYFPKYSEEASTCKSITCMTRRAAPPRKFGKDSATAST